ncbi:hypothetical protein DESA109040_07700 [Deinococcus saxicola]
MGRRGFRESHPLTSHSIHFAPQMRHIAYVIQAAPP